MHVPPRAPFSGLGEMSLRTVSNGSRGEPGQEMIVFSLCFNCINWALRLSKLTSIETFSASGLLGCNTHVLCRYIYSITKHVKIRRNLITDRTLISRCSDRRRVAFDIKTVIAMIAKFLSIIITQARGYLANIIISPPFQQILPQQETQVSPGR